jgi:membrane-associated protease RseP (regulator of RpoE activity)
MQVLIILFGCHVIAMLVHTAGLAVAGRMLGAGILEIGIFVGPALFKTNIRGLDFRLNLLPIGSYVKYQDARSEPASRGKSLQDFHPLIRALIASAGSIALLLVAAICLGPTAAFQHTVSGFVQIISGAFSPSAIGAGLLQLLYQFVSTESLPATLGLVATKETAFNLLPIPILNGGDIILNIVSCVKRISDRARDKVNSLGLVLLLVIYACWLLALVYFLNR